MRRRLPRTRSLRLRAAATVLAAAHALQRLAERVSNTGAGRPASNEEPAVPRPPHLADAPEHWLRMVAEHAPGLLRAPGEIPIEGLPAGEVPTPRGGDEGGRTPAVRPPREDVPRVRIHSREIPRPTATRSPLPVPHRAERVTEARPADGGMASEPGVGSTAPASLPRPRVRAVRQAAATARARATSQPRETEHRVVSEHRAVRQRAGSPQRAPIEGATREHVTTVPVLQADPVSLPGPASAPYPTLPPTPVPVPPAVRRPVADSRPHTPPSWQAPVPRTVPAPVREPEIPATSRWPELPPPTPAGTARMQRRLSDWGADLVRIQEVG